MNNKIEVGVVKPSDQRKVRVNRRGCDSALEWTSRVLYIVVRPNISDLLGLEYVAMVLGLLVGWVQGGAIDRRFALNLDPVCNELVEGVIARKRRLRRDDTWRRGGAVS